MRKAAVVTLVSMFFCFTVRVISSVHRQLGIEGRQPPAGSLGILNLSSFDALSLVNNSWV